MKRFQAIILPFVIIVILTISNIISISNCNSLDNWPTDGWVVSTPEEQDMNPEYLEGMLQYIEDNGYSIDSIILIRNGYLVYEKYFNGWNSQAIHQTNSVTKSITSCLIGIAEEEGLLQLNQTVLSFFPGIVVKNLDNAKLNITIEHLLSMSSGLKWFEAIDAVICFPSESSLQYVLDKPMIAAPGEVFNYNSGNAHLLSAILQNVTGQTTLAYAQDKLFNFLGIENLSWDIDSQGIYYGGHSLCLSSQDMAKFGFLYLNNGTWDGHQIVPENWVSISTSQYNYTVDSREYGYLFWLNPELEHYAANGFLGQRILVFPKYQFVAVVTSPVYKTVYLIPILVSDYLIPSLNNCPYTPQPTSSTEQTQIYLLFPIIITFVLFYFSQKKRR